VVRAHPKGVVDDPAAFVQAAVEDIWRELLGVTDDPDDFVEMAFVVAVNTFNGRNR
jgi:hypothetical protein